MLLKVFFVALLGTLSVHCGEDLKKPVCKPKLQSPIPLSRNISTLNPKLSLTFSSNYFNPLAETAINIGITIKVENAGTDRYVTTEGNKKYFLKESFARWPSEHTIEGKRYPLEIQSVFFRSDFKNLELASKAESGVLVISSLFEVSDKPNPAFDAILKIISQISKSVNKPVKFTGTPGLILPKKSSFYRYQGSVSGFIPQCLEEAVFNVYQKISPISKKQLADFTNIYGPDGKKITRNNRDLQDIKKRKVFFKQV